VLQQVLVHGVRDMQIIDECECKCILTAVGNLGKLALKVVDIGLEVVIMPHLDGEEVMVVLIGFSAGGVLGEKCLNHFLKIAERMRQQGVEPV